MTTPRAGVDYRRTLIRRHNSRYRLTESLRVPVQAPGHPSTTHPDALRDSFTALLSIFADMNSLHGANVLNSSNVQRRFTVSLCLTKNEIKELTLKVRYSAQSRTLAEMGIRHALRPDGSPVVLRATLAELVSEAENKPNQPDFSSLGQ